MRRLPGMALVAVLVALAFFIPAAQGQTTRAEDSFDSGTYSGGSGWASNWTESGDSGSPNSGPIQIVSDDCSGRCLRFTALLGLAGTYRVTRTVNLAGANAATLAFNYERNGLGTLTVGTRSGPGDTTWTEETLNGGNGDFEPHTMSIPTSDISGTTEVRFSLSSPLLVIVAASALVDDVEITATYPATTTTTTTKPSTTTTTKPPTTTTTTTLPVITVPTIPPPTLPTTTTTEPRPTTSTTEAPTTTEARDTTTTSSLPRATTSTTTTSTTVVAAPSEPTPPDRAEAEAAGVILDMSPAGTAQFGRTFGLSPLTSLNADFRSVVEAIQSEVVSALALGLVVALFAVRLPKDPEGIQYEGETPEDDA